MQVRFLPGSHVENIYKMTTHTTFAIISSIVGIFSFFPYIRNIFKGTTKPHSYSWAIWTILQTVGIISMLDSGAGIGVLSLSVGTLFCGFIFILSLKNGTKNIKLFDKICLAGALLAILIYIFLKNPFFSLIIVVITDFVGFLPTFRKAYEEPDTETASGYVLSSMSSILALLALSYITFSTSLYLVSLIITNGLCAFIIFFRRKQLHSKRIVL